MEDSYNISPPTDGCYIFGLYLESSKWNAELKVIDEPENR